MFSDHFGNPVELESASLPARAFAYLADKVFLFLFWLLFYWIITLLDKLGVWDFIGNLISKIPYSPSSLFSGTAGEIAGTVFLSLAVFILIMILYFPAALFEYFSGGRSPGKIIFGLAVFCENGEKPSFVQIFSRAVLRDIESVLGVIFIIATPRRQTLYDILCSTMVKKIRYRKSKVLLPVPAGTGRFSIPSVYHSKIILWQRFYLRMIKQAKRGTATEEYVIKRIIKVLTDNVPEVASLFVNDTYDVNDKRLLIESLSNALDNNGVRWVSR